MIGRALGVTGLMGLALAGPAAAAPVFSVPVPKAITGLAQQLAAGDVTGDGIPDLVALSATSGDSHDVITLAGNGDGTFTRRAGVRIRAEFSNAIVTTGLNNDGKRDVLVDIVPRGGAGNAQVALLNDGTGRFRVAGRVSKENTFGVAVARFDADAFPDVVSPVIGSDLSFFRGVGDGTFAAPIAIRPESPSRIVVADLNDDGRMDLVMEQQVTAPGASATITVSLGNGDGTFGPDVTVAGQPVATAFQYFSGLAVGDLNGDGKQDIVLPATSAVVAALGHGDGTFDPFTAIGKGTRFPAVTGDVDRDGKADVIYNRGKRVVGILGSAFTPFDLTTDSGPHSLVVADFNSDSRPDVAFMTTVATSRPKVRSSAVAVTLNSPSRPVVSGLVAPATIHRGAATAISFVLTEAARVRVTVSRNGRVVRFIDLPGTRGTNHRVIGATKALRAGSYVVAVRARNVRGTTRAVRAALRVR